MTRIYDISRTISADLAVWPGDAPFTVEQNYSLDEGHVVNLTTITMSPHTGSHADAPWHYQKDGAHPADVPLTSYIGPAKLVTVARKHGAIGPEDLTGHDLTGVERLLIRTWVSDVPDNRWPDGFPYLSPAMIDHLAESGVILLGLDMPSPDAQDSADLPAHKRLGKHGMAVLELLRFDSVPDGDYELIALPLKMAGVCGSPVRALLRGE